MSNFKMIEKLDKQLGIIPRNRNEVIMKVREGNACHYSVTKMLIILSTSQNAEDRGIQKSMANFFI
jgi:hypothetical protein